MKTVRYAAYITGGRTALRIFAVGQSSGLQMPLSSTENRDNNVVHRLDHAT